jgi:hypothetical protein
MFTFWQTTVFCCVHIALILLSAQPTAAITHYINIHTNSTVFGGGGGERRRRRKEIRCYKHPSLSAFNWFQKNRALSQTPLTQLHRKVRVQKLKSAT